MFAPNCCALRGCPQFLGVLTKGDSRSHRRRRFQTGGAAMNSSGFTAQKMRGARCGFLAVWLTLSTLATALLAQEADLTLLVQEADLIVHHGKVVTVDRDFSVRQAMAIRNGLILRVGSDKEVLRL